MNVKSSRASGSAQREAILVAATAAFLRYGFKKTSMDDVARAAGVSRQGLYLYFDTKDLLFREALQHLVSHLISTAHAVQRISWRVARGCLRTAAVSAVCRRRPPCPIGPGPDGDCSRSTRGGGRCGPLGGGRRHGRRTVGTAPHERQGHQGFRRHAHRLSGEN